MTLVLMEVPLFPPPPKKKLNHFCIGKLEVIMMYVLKCFKFTMLIDKRYTHVKFKFKKIPF